MSGPALFSLIPKNYLTSLRHAESHLNLYFTEASRRGCCLHFYSLALINLKILNFVSIGLKKNFNFRLISYFSISPTGRFKFKEPDNLKKSASRGSRQDKFNIWHKNICIPVSFCSRNISHTLGLMVKLPWREKQYVCAFLTG